MKRQSVLLTMLTAVSGMALVGCSPGKAPAAHSAPSATASSPAAAAAPAATTAAATPAASAGAGPAAPSGQGNGAPARADLVLLAGAAFDGCKAPTPPPDPPDGNVATREQMLNAHKLTADFNTATDTYLDCLDHAADTFNRQYGRIMPVSSMRDVVDMQARIHNHAVDADRTVANKFNVQLRAYKARGGKT